MFGFARSRFLGLARKLVTRSRRDSLGTFERLLVVRDPVQKSLPHHGNDDLDRVRFFDVLTDELVGVFDGADDEDVSCHGKLPLPARLVTASQPPLEGRPGMSPQLPAEPEEHEGAQSEHCREFCTTEG